MILHENINEIQILLTNFEKECNESVKFVLMSTILKTQKLILINLFLHLVFADLKFEHTKVIRFCLEQDFEFCAYLVKLDNS